MLPDFAPIHGLYLAIAIVLEIAANVLMKRSHGFTYKRPAVAAIACALAETLDAVPAGGIGIGRDVEATAARRKGQAGEVIGRGGGGNRQRRHHSPERRHRLEPLAGGRDRDGRTRLKAEPDGVAQEMTQ